MPPAGAMPSLAACCYSLFAACHALLALVQWHHGGDVGSAIVVAIAIALVWDNGLIALGRTLFPRAADPNSRDCARLIAFSQPRFFGHAFLTPLLAVQASRLGSRAGIDWLKQGSVTSSIVLLIAGCLSFLGTLHHLRHPSLVFKRPHALEPKGSWMRSIVSATLAETSPTTLAWMIGPAVLVCLWTFCVGASMAKLHIAAGHWLWVSAVVELLSNAGPPWVMALTGNAGEVVLLGGFVAAESVLLSEGK